MKLEFSGQILKKYSNMMFNENLSIVSQVFPCEEQTDRQKDRHDEFSSHFSQFWERA